MIGHSVKTDFQAFVQFAPGCIERGDCGESVEELVQKWRSGSEHAAAVADIRQGLVDDSDGGAESVAATFAVIRRELGLVE